MFAVLEENMTKNINNVYMYPCKGTYDFREKLVTQQTIKYLYKSMSNGHCPPIIPTVSYLTKLPDPARSEICIYYTPCIRKNTLLLLLTSLRPAQSEKGQDEPAEEDLEFQLNQELELEEWTCSDARQMSGAREASGLVCISLGLTNLWRLHTNCLACQPPRPPSPPSPICPDWNGIQRQSHGRT